MKLPSTLSPNKEKEFRAFTKKWVDKELSPYSAQLLVKELREIFTVTVETSELRRSEQHYFRVRTGDVDDIKDPKEYSYPRPKIVGQGRCHLKGHPVFYASESPLVALNETSVKPGEKCYLSMWGSGENYPNYAQYIFTEKAESKRLQAYYQSYKEKFLNMEPKPTSTNLLWFSELLTELFVADTHTIAAAFSHIAIYVNGFDGIEYLDAKSRKWYNFALNPSFADKLKLEAVLYLSRGEGSVIEYISTGKVFDGRIDWRDFRDTDLEELMAGKRYVREDGRPI